MKKEEVIPYFLGRGEVKPTIKTNLGLFCGVMCYLWVVYCVGLMVGDLVSLPFNWYSAYAEASAKEQNEKQITKTIEEMEYAQTQFHTLLKQQPGLKKCIRLYKQIQAVGGTPVPCKTEPVESIKVATGTVVPPATIIPKANAEPITYRGAGDNQVRSVPFVGWRVPSHGQIKTYIELKGAKVSDRMWHLLHIYGLGNTYQAWVDTGERHRIIPEVLVCIAWADSDLGAMLKSRNNIGNVGNNDRGNTVKYSSLEAGIDAMGRVLNNQYLGYKQSIGSLSPGGGGTGFFYATSTENWNANVINCLNMIYGKAVVDENFLFRKG